MTRCSARRARSDAAHTSADTDLPTGTGPVEQATSSLDTGGIGTSAATLKNSSRTRSNCWPPYMRVSWPTTDVSIDSSSTCARHAKPTAFFSSSSVCPLRAGLPSAVPMLSFSIHCRKSMTYWLAALRSCSGVMEVARADALARTCSAWESSACSCVSSCGTHALRRRHDSSPMDRTSLAAPIVRSYRRSYCSDSSWSKTSASAAARSSSDMVKVSVDTKKILPSSGVPADRLKKELRVRVESTDARYFENWA
mmetsp:Transcript_5334/g.17190  ORF Transcript_5334/g.17190 Transcript_5334/m.17190 type:complete len:253 (+) Transcript_5334:1315-2073(+)